MAALEAAQAAVHEDTPGAGTSAVQASQSRDAHELVMAYGTREGPIPHGMGLALCWGLTAPADPVVRAGRGLVDCYPDDVMFLVDGAPAAPSYPVSDT